MSKPQHDEEVKKGLLSVLQPDLRALGVEARNRRNVSIKEATERATVKLR